MCVLYWKACSQRAGHTDTPAVPAPLQAFKNLDYGQFKLVFEALHERNVLLRNVPYLSHPLPIMTVGAGQHEYPSCSIVLRPRHPQPAAMCIRLLVCRAGCSCWPQQVLPEVGAAVLL